MEEHPEDVAIGQTGWVAPGQTWLGGTRLDLGGWRRATPSWVAPGQTWEGGAWPDVAGWPGAG